MRRRALGWFVAVALGLGVLAPGLACGGEGSASSDASLQEALARPITLRLEETSLGEALSMLEQITGLNLVLDPSVSRSLRVTLQLKDISTRNALTLLMNSAGGCSYETWRGCVYVQLKTSPAPQPPAPELTDKARGMLGRSVTLSFPATALSDIAAFLKDVTGLPFSAGPEVARRPVRLRARNLTLGAALDVLCRVTRTRVVKAPGGGLVLTPVE